MTERKAKKGDLVTYADTIYNAHEANALGVVTKVIDDSTNKRKPSFVIELYWLKNSWVEVEITREYEYDSGTLKLLSKPND